MTKKTATSEPQRQPLTSVQPQRKMTSAMLKLTVVVTVGLSIIAGAIQLVFDLVQEMDQVETAATKFIESVAPVAEKAVWNFDRDGAIQVANGLFSQRAILTVTIHAENEIFYQQSREIEPTLPYLSNLIFEKTSLLSRDLMTPSTASLADVNTSIGRLEIVVDRTMVSPNVVDRLLVYFGVGFLKNALLGAFIVLLVFGGLARHILSIAKSLSSWRPADGAVSLSRPPSLLRGTEIEALGDNIDKLTTIAGRELVALQMSNDRIADLNSALISKSEGLSKALQQQNNDLEVANAKLLELAITDGLTGAFNRRHFEEIAERKWAEARSHRSDFAIFLIDVDYFKNYNDHYGHIEGDACLKSLSEAMREVIETEGGLFARYGGEEFIALVETLKGTDAVPDKIVNSIGALQLNHVKSMISNFVTVSVGAAYNCDVKAQTLDELINSADVALYGAKTNGRNQFNIADGQLLKELKQNRAVEDALQLAIRQRAFEPYFQAQVDVRTGKIVGVEALARWASGRGGIQVPGDFFSALEKLGGVGRVDAIVQEKSLQHLKNWIKSGIQPPRLSLNLSEEALLSGNVAALLQGISPEDRKLISFELLESIALEKKSAAFDDRLNELLSQGVYLEIDDFGTGATSISALARISPDRIKIARELVSLIGHSPKGAKVVQAVVEIAQAFQIDVIAEGIETEEQSKKLLSMGVPVQQGYLHGRPIPADEMTHILTQQASKSGQILKMKAS